MLGAAALLLLAGSACSVRKLAVRSVAGALAASGDVFAADDDPELVRDAAPFALKTMEALLEEVPRHRGLLLGACRGFTQYAYAFVETDALLLERSDFGESLRLRGRALGLYLRGRDYCLRALELEDPGIAQRLRSRPEVAALGLGPGAVELTYWTAASWGAAIAAGADRPELVADLPAVIALMRRVLEFDERYDDGAAHEVFIALESLPANLGGSLERARRHFERAVALAGGARASPYLALAVDVAVAEQDRAEFVALLERALTVDVDAHPATRLQNLVVQRRARYLLEHVDDLILGPDPAEEP